MRDKLKIGFVLDDTLDSTDGVQQYILTLGAWLSTQGHEVRYLVGETKRADMANVHSLARNLRVRFNGNRLSIPLPAARGKLKSFLAAEKFDVLHIQMPYSPWLAHRIIQVAPEATAIVGTFHVMPYSRLVHIANRALALRLRSTLRQFDQVFAVSSAAQTFAKHTYGIESTVLPNVVDEVRFRNAEPMPEYDDDKLTIMFLGRLVPRKGCRTLLEAVVILKQRNHLPPFRVVVCGKGPLEADLKKYVADQRLDELVTFTGFVDETDKPAYIASADVMTYPSSGGESFGIVLLEAMASGRPVVLAGDNPGYRTVLNDRLELLFTPDQPFELANKLTVYLRDVGERKREVQWQQQFVHQFDVSVVGEQLTAEYRHLLQKKR